jgi:hypothetical protein
MNKFCLLLFSILCVFTCILSSCNDSSDCNYEANRKVKLAFAKENEKGVSDTTIADKLIVTSSIGEKIYDTSYVGQIGLPLSQVNDTSVFYLNFNNKYCDTLTLISDRKIEMISSNCGFNTRFTIDTILYTKNNILSIIIVEKNIDKDLDMGRNCKVIVKKANVLKINLTDE